MNIGQAIKDLRKKKNISQVELARRIKISPTSLSQIEGGIKRPGPKTLKKICAALKVPELLIHLMATEEKDIPKEQLELFKLLFPTLKSLVNQIAGES